MIEGVNWKWFGDNLSNFDILSDSEEACKAWKRIHILYDAYCDAKANKMDLMLLLPQPTTEGIVLYFAQELIHSMVQISMGGDVGDREASEKQVKILKKILSSRMV